MVQIIRSCSQSASCFKGSAWIWPRTCSKKNDLFPYIEVMERAETQDQPVPFAPFGTVKNPIRMMMMEHDTAGDILRKLRAVTSDYRVPSDGCISYQTLYQALEGFEKDLHQHIHLENNLLFPAIAVGKSLKSKHPWSLRVELRQSARTLCFLTSSSNIRERAQYSIGMDCMAAAGQRVPLSGLIGSRDSTAYRSKNYYAS